jgi:transcriptional regulator with XRE-family HTH domain
MKALTAKIKSNGITAKAIAERAGLSPSYVSMLLNGQRSNPSASVVGKIVAASGGALSHEDFIGFEA